AAAFYERHQDSPIYGAGFVFTRGDNLVFLDFDHCLDEQGTLKDWARPLVMPFLDKTYIERSPSGKGLHIFVVGRAPATAGTRSGMKRKIGDGAVEVYWDRRFSTVTGDTVRGAELAELQP